MPTAPTISSLRAGDEVRGVYACVRKDRLKTRTGSPYLALELRDRSGSVQARAFRDADALAGRFERGDLVAVVGRVERFREDLVIEVTDIRRSEAPSEEFLPVAYRDLDELDGFLEHLASEVYDAGFKMLLDSLLGDHEVRTAFRRTPCTRNGHHAYLGGLLEHTVAVATLARELCDLHRRLNSDLLITAAIVHDIGRMREFTYGAEIGLSDEGRLLGHLTLGQQLLTQRFAILDASASASAGAGGAAALDETRRLALLHCVLTHHGPASAPAGASPRPRRSRSTAATRWTPASRACSNMGSGIPRTEGGRRHDRGGVGGMTTRTMST